MGHTFWDRKTRKCAICCVAVFVLAYVHSCKNLPQRARYCAAGLFGRTAAVLRHVSRHVYLACYPGASDTFTFAYTICLRRCHGIQLFLPFSSRIGTSRRCSPYLRFTRPCPVVYQKSSHTVMAITPILAGEPMVYSSSLHLFRQTLAVNSVWIRPEMALKDLRYATLHHLLASDIFIEISFTRQSADSLVTTSSHQSERRGSVTDASWRPLLRNLCTRTCGRRQRRCMRRCVRRMDGMARRW